ncbi:MAG: DUF1800 domain-containing protein [Planctomycetota bacterium]
MRILLTLSLALALVRPAPAGGDPLAPKDPASFTLEDARHLLFRAGFGGTPDEVARLHRMGLEGAVAWLVDYEKRPDIVGPIDVPQAEPVDRRAYQKLSEDERRKLQNERRREDGQKFLVLRAWWMERMLRGLRPLEEKMTLFWSGHFTSSYRDVRNATFIWQQNELLRRHATGNFGELLHEVSRDPAMLLYLNNQQNRRGRPNENYAREVMELFTLGIGNYTEQDIKEAARAFTGWQVDGRRGTFVFNRGQHDFGRKTFLGKEGNLGGEEVLDHLLEQDACAPYVAGKVWTFLAAGQPDPELRAALGAVLAGSEWELKPLLRAILRSEAFYAPGVRGRQVKSPVEFVVSTVRMLGMNPPPPVACLAACDKLGQSLLMPPNVKGWEGGLAWITTATMLDRNNLSGIIVKLGDQDSTAGMNQRQARELATEMGMGEMRGARGAVFRQLGRWDSGIDVSGLCAATGARSAEDLVDALLTRMLFAPLPEARRQALVDYVKGADGSTPLEFDKLHSVASEAKLRKLLHLIMSTPEFQLC